MVGDLENWLRNVQIRDNDRRNSMARFITWPLWHIGGIMMHHPLQVNYYEWEYKWWWRRKGIALLTLFGIVDEST